MSQDNFDTYEGGYTGGGEPDLDPVGPTIQARVQAGVAVSQERIAHHLGELVAQAEANARAERQQERQERADQQRQMIDAMRDLAAAAQAMAESNARAREQTEALNAEMRTLRSAILLAHSIGREEGGASPLGLDVAKGSFEPFALPAQAQVSGQAATGAAPAKVKRTRNLSPEARERISAAQKARWAAQRASND
jgi:hypothetical protein